MSEKPVRDIEMAEGDASDRRRFQENKVVGGTSKLLNACFIVAFVLLFYRVYCLEFRVIELETSLRTGDRRPLMGNEPRMMALLANGRARDEEMVVEGEAMISNDWIEQPTAVSERMPDDGDMPIYDNLGIVYGTPTPPGGQVPEQQDPGDLDEAAEDGDGATHRRSKRSAPEAERSPRRPTRKPPNKPSQTRNTDTAMFLTMDVELHDSDFRQGQPFLYKAWKVADWANGSHLYAYDRTTGHISVKKKGVYYVFAQLLYHNAAARSCYVIKAHSVDRHGLIHHHRSLAKCWSSVDVVDSGESARFKTCHVGTLVTLERDQQIWVEDPYGNFIRPDSESNFFGIFKVADL